MLSTWRALAALQSYGQHFLELLITLSSKRQGSAVYPGCYFLKKKGSRECVWDQMSLWSQLAWQRYKHLTAHTSLFFLLFLTSMWSACEQRRGSMFLKMRWRVLILGLGVYYHWAQITHNLWLFLRSRLILLSATGMLLNFTVPIFAMKPIDLVKSNQSKSVSKFITHNFIFLCLTWAVMYPLFLRFWLSYSIIFKYIINIWHRTHIWWITE